MKLLRGVLLVVIVLCGGAGCASTVAPPPTALTPVTLQLQWVTQAQFAGYYVAFDKGWYAEEGIALTINPGGPDIVPIDRVAAGLSDFATTLLADLTVAVDAGKPVISIAQIQQQNGLLLVTQATSGIQRPEDFAGRRVGVWLGGWEVQFNALMAQAGLAERDFTLIPQGYSMEAFIRGDLDVASAMVYNEYHTVLAAGFAPSDLTIINYADYDLDFPGDTLLTSRALLERDPDLCVRMVRASLRGWQYAIEHPEEAVDIVLKYDESGVQTREHQLAMMREIAKLVQAGGHPLGYTAQEDVARVNATLTTYNILGSALAPESVYTNAIWEQATAK